MTARGECLQRETWEHQNVPLAAGPIKYKYILCMLFLGGTMLVYGFNNACRACGLLERKYD